MLDRLRNRVNQFFTEEIEVEVEIEEEPTAIDEKPNHHTQPFQTKMMYQYPTKSSFRFPVIPDEGERDNPLEIPAYQRRRRESRQDVEPNVSEEKVIKKISKNSYRVRYHRLYMVIKSIKKKRKLKIYPRL